MTTLLTASLLAPCSVRRETDPAGRPEPIHPDAEEILRRSRAGVDALQSRAAAALLAGRGVEDSVLAPLANGPLDGASIADVEAVLSEAVRVARKGAS